MSGYSKTRLPLARLVAALGLLVASCATAADWTPSQRSLIASLSLSGLPPVRADWRNPRAGDADAVAFGALLFAEVRLSSDRRHACASCHDPARAFTDGEATASGRTALPFNTPTLPGSAHFHWQGWSGRFASPVAQGAAPIESVHELGGTRTGLARLVMSAPPLREAYAAVAGPPHAFDTARWPPRAMPVGTRRERRAWRRIPRADRAAINAVFDTAAESLAAYVAGITPTATRFDRYADSLDDTGEGLLSRSEVRGLALFIGRANCVQCHGGPLFSDGRFHNIGTGDPGSPSGRRAALAAFERDCRSDAPTRPLDCARAGDAAAAEVPALLDGAFRTPSLRAVGSTAPYLHDGRLATLEDVLAHYREPADKSQRRHELPASLDLGDRDIVDLAAFLRTL